MSSLVKRNKVYHLCWYQGKKTCPLCNGEKVINKKSCKRCRGSGEVPILHKKRLSADRQTALDYKAEFEAKLRRNELGLQDTKKTWMEFVEEFFTYSKAKKRPTTHTIDRYAINTFTNIVKPYKIIQLTPQQIEQWERERLKSVSPAQVNKELRHLKSALSKAVQWKYINENPAKYVKQSKIPKNPPKFLSKKEIKKLISAADDKMKLIIKTFIYTGLRISELINLRWQDVDFKRQEITIQTHDNFQPKDYEARTITLHEKLFKLLYPIRQEQGLIFLNEYDEQYADDILEKKFRKLTKKVGITNCTPHTLRHTYASHLVMSGGDLVTIKELLGHSNINTTMIYVHLSKSHKKKVVAKLNYGL